MSDPTHKKSTSRLDLRKNLIAGILTVIPLYVVYLVVDLMVSLLSGWGRPVIIGMADAIAPTFPGLASLLHEPAALTITAVFMVILLLYFLGIAASWIVGARMIAWFETLINRIPFIKTIYGSTKQLLNALQTKPNNVQRVVLIDFPHPDMRAIGLVMKTFQDETTGRELAAVYVPTTPNPTSGYLEIVPVDKLTSTNLTMDEAMAMVISGGAVSPDKLRYESPKT